jgi:(2R)-ethylmalonyl-CoA mutase
VDAPVIVGGIIPEEDRAALLTAGVRAVYTPKDFELARIMDDIAGFTEEHRAALSGASSSCQPEAGGER